MSTRQCQGNDRDKRNELRMTERSIDPVSVRKETSGVASTCRMQHESCTFSKQALWHTKINKYTGWIRSTAAAYIEKQETSEYNPDRGR